MNGSAAVLSRASSVTHGPLLSEALGLCFLGLSSCWCGLACLLFKLCYQLVL